VVFTVVPYGTGLAVSLGGWSPRSRNTMRVRARERVSCDGCSTVRADRFITSEIIQPQSEVNGGTSPDEDGIQKHRKIFGQAESGA
jgi:hypothetical protein